MNTQQSEYVVSSVSLAQGPSEKLPEIALAGRSNVGKSSFINAMLNRKNLARTSSQPGKTRTINYFRVNQVLYFVDLPGYGYAGVSKTEKQKWGPMIEGYLEHSETLKAVVLLVDSRHPPTKQDQEMYSYLIEMGFHTLVVGTKLDKLSRGQWQKARQTIKTTLGMAENAPLFLFSSETKEGRDELWGILERYIGHS